MKIFGKIIGICTASYLFNDFYNNGNLLYPLITSDGYKIDRHKLTISDFCKNISDTNPLHIACAEKPILITYQEKSVFNAYFENMSVEKYAARPCANGVFGRVMHNHYITKIKLLSNYNKYLDLLSHHPTNFVVRKIDIKPDNINVAQLSNKLLNMHGVMQHRQKIKITCNENNNEKHNSIVKIGNIDYKYSVIRYIVYSYSKFYTMMCEHESTYTKFDPYNKKTGKYNLTHFAHNLLKSFKYETKKYPVIFYVKNFDDEFYNWLITTNKKIYVTDYSYFANDDDYQLEILFDKHRQQISTVVLSDIILVVCEKTNINNLGTVDKINLLKHHTWNTLHYIK